MERGTVLHDGAPKTMTLCEIIHFQSETLTVDVATKNSDLNSSLPGRSECMSFSFDGVLMVVALSFLNSSEASELRGKILRFQTRVALLSTVSLLPLPFKIPPTEPTDR
jgi:hypothetical protein